MNVGKLAKKDRVKQILSKEEIQNKINARNIKMSQSTKENQKNKNI